jgi:N-acetyl-gamma-glutamyl-phosphate reductase
MITNIRVGIAGAAGYTGGELIRLLLRHPHVRIAWAHSHSQAGKPVSQTHDDLLGITDLVFTDQFVWDIDLLFLCVGHGEARKLLAAHEVPAPIRIIDLSQDFRLSSTAQIGQRNFVYGLPELNRDAIRQANGIANPGCFATAIQLALLPLAKHHALDTVYVTGITGSTGAGQSPTATSHFSWRASNIQAYKTLNHQHLAEVTASLQQLQPTLGKQNDMPIRFVPWRGDFPRGIFVTAQVSLDAFTEEIKQWYADYYSAHLFTQVVDLPLHLKQVVNTNRCLIQLEQQGEYWAIHAAIDNLLKGASGQAVQNMNLMFGWEETIGLDLKANYF